MSRITVLDPTGDPPKITATPLAPRLDPRNGHTVYRVGNDQETESVDAWR